MTQISTKECIKSNYLMIMRNVCTNGQLISVNGGIWIQFSDLLDIGVSEYFINELYTFFFFLEKSSQIPKV